MRFAALVGLLVIAAPPAAAAPQGGLVGVQTAKLLAAGGGVGHEFGAAISASDSGDRVLVGSGTFSNGTAYVFVDDGTGWVQESVVSAGAAQSAYGSAVVLAGTTAIVGAPYDIVLTVRKGAAHVFERSGTAWSYQARLVADDGHFEDAFGSAVALHGDTAVVGSNLDDGPAGIETGSAYVFVRTGTSWARQTKFVPTDVSEKAQFGTAVAVFGDVAAVGAPHDDAPSPSSPSGGSVYVYRRSGTVWTQEQKLVRTGSKPFDQLGTSLALEGDTLVAGSPGSDVAGSDAGSVCVFTWDGANWNQTAELAAAGAGTADYLGFAVDLRGDTVLAGAPFSDAAVLNSGAAYAFRRDAAGWSGSTRLLADDPAAHDWFGAAVAVSGQRAFVGAPQDDDQGTLSGSAYAFSLLPEPVSYCTAKPNSCGFAPAIAWSGVSSASGSSGFTVDASGARAGKVGVLLYSPSGRANLPFQGGTLCVGTTGLRRSVPVTATGGTPGPACDALFALDVNAFAAGALGGNHAAFLSVVGNQVDAQWWGRDTPAHGSLLSDALEFFVGP